MPAMKVAVPGGFNGNLGPPVVNALVDSGFDVTVLSRTGSPDEDPRVKVQQVDYNNLGTLVDAFIGQDAVVNTLGVGAVPLAVHLRIIDAAQAARVKRLIPSEFGCDTANSETAKMDVFSDKMSVMSKLEELSKKAGSKFTYSAIINGAFLDWSIKNNFVVNFAGPTTEIYDGGDVIFSATTLPVIGKAVVGVLEHLEETKNRRVYVSEVETSQNELIRLSGRDIERVAVDTGAMEEKGYEALNQIPPDMYTFVVSSLRRILFGVKYGAHFQKTDNELLGIKKLSEPELVEVIKKNL